MALPKPIQDAIDAAGAQHPGRDFIFISRTVERTLHRDVTAALGKEPTQENCTVFLTSFGGDPHAAYRIARCLRHHYKHLRIVIPSYCKSAGTLIVIAANEVAIGDLGELGPLDVQVSKPSEIFERGSGLDIMQALQVVLQHAHEAFGRTMMEIRTAGLSTKLAGELATKIAAGVAEPLYSQIDPNRLGEMQRAMRIAHEYGERLNKYSGNLKPNALNRLVAEYPSHSFVIDRKEAKELFRNVGAPSVEECELSRILWDQFGEESGFGPLVAKPSPPAAANEGAANGQPVQQGAGDVQPAAAAQ